MLRNDRPRPARRAAGVAVLAALAIVTSCTTWTAKPAETRIVEAPASAASSTRPTLVPSTRPDDRIGPADLIQVRVEGQESLDAKSQPDASGALGLPLIGSVPAIGRTPDELEQDIRSRLQAYLRAPLVNVTVQAR